MESLREINQTQAAAPLLGEWLQKLFSSLSAVCLVCLAAVPLTARESGQKTAELGAAASLEDILHYAAENSPALRAAFEEWRAAVEVAPQARSLPDPELSYGYWVDRSTERLGIMGRQRLTVTQILPGFGKRGLREEMALRSAESAEQRLEALRLAIFARVKIAYAEYAYVEGAIEVLRELQELIEEIETVALARYRAGEVGSADVLRIEMEAEKFAEELRTMEQMRRPTSALLNAAAGRPAEAPLPAPQLEKLPALEEGTERGFETWLAGNPNLRAREREIARADAGVELARREGRPDFMVGAELMERRGEGTEGMIMVGVTLPIWRENYAAARREARANRNAAVERYRGLELDLEADLRMALFRVRDAERKIKLHGERLHPLAVQSYNLLAAGYRTVTPIFSI